MGVCARSHASGRNNDGEVLHAECDSTRLGE